MNVNRNSLPDMTTQPPPPAPWPRLRRPREMPPGNAAAAADQTASTPANIAATMPSWPRIFPGL